MARFDSWSQEDLAWKCRELSDKIEALESENDKLYRENQHLNYRVANELEPRIKSEHDAYDRWATDPERR